MQLEEGWKRDPDTCCCPHPPILPLLPPFWPPLPRLKEALLQGTDQAKNQPSKKDNPIQLIALVLDRKKRGS